MCFTMSDFSDKLWLDIPLTDEGALPSGDESGAPDGPSEDTETEDEEDSDDDMDESDDQSGAHSLPTRTKRT